MRVEGTPGEILKLLREGPRQAQALASDLGIDTSAVRRHLERLDANGFVTAQDLVDGPGRPKKMYRLTDEGRETFHREYATLLNLLLEKTEALHGRRGLEALVASVAKDVAAAARAEPSEPRRLAALLGIYNGLGFEADLERTRSGLRLVQRNCAVLSAARRDSRLLCECFDEGLIRAALPGATVTLEASQALGDATCRHRIRLKRAE